MKQYFSILFIGFFLSGISELSAQVILYPSKSDTTYFKRKIDGQLKPASPSKADLYIVEYYKNNELTERKTVSLVTEVILGHEFYKSGRPYGKWKYYNPAEDVIFERDFSKLVYGVCEVDLEPDEDITLPQFGKGERDLMVYLRRHILYPAKSRSLGTTGIVMINFVVDESGKANVSHICDNGLDGYCDLVVWEIVEQMPRWKPGRKDGKPVEVSYFLPVSFDLR